MAELIFRLNGVPDDEADEVRELLRQHDIPFYETEAGNWGISLAALWVHEKEHALMGESLIADYQRERAARQQIAASEQERPSWWMHWQQQPLRVSAYIILIAILVYFSIQPFIAFG